ncbi:MAG: biotin--[acetyl-CoA-carboxylase] ligase [Chloroflexi bacterium]|nr:biotin--[acetyl-CoA-carboxylase] ligase [Ktedonobacteraceae bacterium]MBV9707069.1 biotin--[acetyl-CoA-carboxylase] ligase [Chloroflexota bacterium]
MNEVETTSRQLNIEILRQTLQTRTFGIAESLIYVPTLDSTNTFAMHLAQQGTQEGVVVLTDNQTAGKGRQGRRWQDIAGCSVLSSIILRPHFSAYLLVMIASLAVVDAIAESSAVQATIKWPNDVLIQDRKVAGILIETSRDRLGQLIAIMGIGVNANGSPVQTAMPSLQATTLAAACGHEVSREELIAHLLKHVEDMYQTLQQEAQDPLPNEGTSLSQRIRARWRSQLSTLGRSIQVRQGDTILSGVAEDVDENGELFLRDHCGKRVSITWGDVGYPTE